MYLMLDENKNNHLLLLLAHFSEITSDRNQPTFNICTFKSMHDTARCKDCTDIPIVGCPLFCSPPTQVLPLFPQLCEIPAFQHLATDLSDQTQCIQNLKWGGDVAADTAACYSSHTGSCTPSSCSIRDRWRNICRGFPSPPSKSSSRNPAGTRLKALSSSLNNPWLPVPAAGEPFPTSRVAW